MTELELYKYINDNDIEWHRHDNDGKQDIIILPYTFQLEGFSKLIENYDPDEGLEMRLKNGYVGIWMNDLCEYYGIDMDKVFCGDEQ
jgi:hypothetical protein